MFRIFQDQDDKGVTLRFEGKLLGPWVEDVRSHCARFRRNAACVRLDLSSLSFVDDAGEEALRELMGMGFEIAACSNFVAELLDREMKK